MTIERGLMTSSSLLPLRALLPEIHAVDGVDRFDITYLRDVDIHDLVAAGCLDPLIAQVIAPDTDNPMMPYSVIEMLASPGSWEPVAEWLRQEFAAAGGDLRISAFGTYFPDLTSVDDRRREFAIGALTNCVLCAIHLKGSLMDEAIVEAVCGTVLDTSDCRGCIDAARACKIVDADHTNCMVYEYGRGYKIDLLCRSLIDVIERVERVKPDAKTWAIGLELEPGDTYVLNDDAALYQLAEYWGEPWSDTRPDTGIAEERYEDLRAHVGLNLDVAHMRIADISAASLTQFAERFVHAHLSDHPGMHTRDQTVGKWTPVERRYGGGYRPYIKLLKSLTDRNPEALPFSRTVALEMEGCNRLRSVHNSLTAMKRLLLAR